MEVKHCCADCGEVMAVHEHSSWQEIKDCVAGTRALCDSCRQWPQSPRLPRVGTRRQEDSYE
jgi:hypothetical protein